MPKSKMKLWTNGLHVAKMASVKSAFLLAIVFLIAGCGKGTGLMGGNPFGGSWRGTYQDSQDEKRDGSIQMQIDAIGQVKGEGQHMSGYSDWTFEGEVDKFGKFTGTITGTYAGPVTGKLIIDKDGSLKGKLSQNPANGTSYPNWIELKRPTD